MGFLNEYTSEEDVIQHDLEEMLYEYNPVYRNKLPSVFRYTWTIDRNNDVYFFNVGGRPGAPDFGTQYILCCQGRRVMVRLRLSGEGSLSYDDVPYIIVWDLLQIKYESESLVRHEIIAFLKDALTTYVDCGIRSHVLNTIVKFNF